MDIIRRAVNYILEEDTNFQLQNNPFLQPLLAQPLITIKYYKLEILLGMSYNIIFASFFIIKICPTLLENFLEAKLTTAIFSIIFLLNFIGQFPKLYIIYKFYALDVTMGSHQLRQQLMMLFSKRIYIQNFKISSFIMISHLLGLSFTIFSLIKGGTEWVEKYLFIWCVSFIFRILISFYRYSRYFGGVMSSKTDEMIYDLPTFKFLEHMKLTHPRLKNDIECLICRIEFEVDEELVEFPCGGKHCFHEKCIRKWLSRKATCPACNQLLYDARIFNSDY